MCSLVAPNLIHSSPNPVSMPLAIIVFEDLAARFVADAMEQLATSPHILNCRQVAAFVMHARQPVAHELLGDVRDAIALACRALLRAVRRPSADVDRRRRAPDR